MKVFAIMFTPGIIVLLLLLLFYPHTGLGRILTIPITLVINLFLVALGTGLILSIKKIVFRNFIISIIILLTIYTTLSLYPQDFGPHVTEKILNDILGKAD